MKSDTRDQAQALWRLQIAGQAAALERMVDEDRYYVDILMQIAAVRGALYKVEKLLPEGHVETCVTHAIECGRPNEGEKSSPS